jgi:hypothetical protein
VYSPTWSVPHRADVVKFACRTTFVQNLGTEFYEDPTNSLVADTSSRTNMVSKQFFFFS